MKALLSTLLIVSFLVAPAITYAGTNGSRHSSGRSPRSGSSNSSRSHSWSSRSYTPSPGTGSKLSSAKVRSYTKKDGSVVEGHRRTTADTKFENNYSTKGNTNPYTGKDGTKVTPPEKK